MWHVKVEWLNPSNEEPTWMYSEVDDDNNEIRKVYLHADGVIELAGYGLDIGTELAYESMPSLNELKLEAGFLSEAISEKEFNVQWEKAISNHKVFDDAGALPFSQISRVGGWPSSTQGYPDYRWNGISEWPHVEANGELYPLKFLCQLEVTDGNFLYVFLGLEDENLPPEDYVPEDGANAAYIHGQEVPSWVHLKILETAKAPIWSETAISINFDIDNIKSEEWTEDTDWLRPLDMKYFYRFNSGNNEYNYDKLPINIGDGNSAYVVSDDEKKIFRVFIA